MKSVMGHSFSNIPGPQIQRSVFNRSHGHKTTFDAGYLVPCFVDEILPGDTVNLKATYFGRIATLIYPLMDNVSLDCFFFYVPNRLLWSNWERFNGAQDQPDSPIDYEVPVIVPAGSEDTFTLGSLGDYFGLPTGVSFEAKDYPMALPFRAYNLIWNEWFRDQNLQDKLTVDLDDGPDDEANYQLQRRGKRHDYFTSALPFPQRGDSVELPLGDSAPVIGNGTTIGVSDSTGNYGIRAISAGGYFTADTAADGTATGSVVTPGSVASARTIGLTTDPALSGMIADLSAATAATINELRYAFAVQKILERDARGGTRYVEHLKAHWGVISPDFRMQRPEYLGGFSQRLDVRQVPQTSPTSGSNAQGQLAAFGQVGMQSGFNKSFVEHGIIMGLVNVRADITYQGGINKMWNRRTRFDFYNPALAHLGEQAIMERELFYDGTANSIDTWAYQERWAEYRYKPSFVTGLFRSNAAGTLHAWHLALNFNGTVPAYNSSWIPDDPPIDRVIAVNTQPHIICDMYFEYKHARPMPVYSVPGQIDRF